MSSKRSRFIRAVSVCSGGLGILASASALQAQQAPAASGDIETVVITGSHIQRRDYEANSPIVTVDESFLKNSSTAAIETDLAKLPQFHPVQTPTMGGDIQPTPTNSPGAATVSLRGLGANRNLVLLDGRRATPGNASQVVDINTIPSIAIDRVETITGGASATYGADAVGGVVNFIMKRNVQGLQLDAQASQSERGDGFEYQVGGIMGASLNEGKGNITFAFALNDRESSDRVDRPWFRSAMRDPTIAGDEFFPTFSAYDSVPNALGPNLPQQSTINGIFTADPAGSVSNANRFYFNPNGTAFTGFFQSFSPGGAGTERFTGDLTGLKWKKTTDGQLNQNFQDAFLVLPLTRRNFFTNADYEINDYFTVFAQGMFSKVEVKTIQQPSPSVNGWAAFIPRDGRAVPTELNTILSSRAQPNDPWRLTYYLDYANRDLRSDVLTYQMQVGLRGKIGHTDWTWEAYGSTGESETTALTTGVASLQRFRAVIGAPNWGKGFNSLTAGFSNPSFGGFGANFATCTSGFDPFHKEIPITQDCIDAISSDLKTRSNLKQEIWEANTQGKVMDLPAGELRAALGATYRKSDYEFLNDTLTSQGTEFNDQAIGIYPSGDSGGSLNVKEIYAELLVPVLHDLPFMKKLELELGVRSSDYNVTGKSTTWKALFDWRAVDWLRFRGGYNRAERSPNVGELYLAPSQTFQVGAGGDLCSFGSLSPVSVSTVANPTGAAKALTLCRALMEKSSPGTANTFYSNPQFSNAAGPAFAFPSVRGNPILKPETAKTWTFGTVFNSPFEGDLARNLRLSIDYYNIKVADAIGPQSVDVAQRQCFDPAFNPGYDVNSPFCLGINRVANDGALGNILLTYLNNGRFETSGIDTSVDWAFDIGPGRFALNSVFSYLLSLKSAELAVDPLLEYAGTLGPNQNELNAGSFEWKMFNTFSYTVANWTATANWQHLPSIKSIQYPTNKATTFKGAPSYDLIGLSGSYAITSTASVRIGVDNLFDKAPPLTERNSAPFPGQLPGGGFGGANSANPALYDFIGRRYFVFGQIRF
jgi:iron complex outermembrane receptor protein